MAALFGAAQRSSTPEISAERLNEMSHVFGRDEAEGLRHFEVRKSLKCPHCDVTAGVALFMLCFHSGGGV